MSEIATVRRSWRGAIATGAAMLGVAVAAAIADALLRAVPWRDFSLCLPSFCAAAGVVLGRLMAVARPKPPAKTQVPDTLAAVEIEIGAQDRPTSFPAERTSDSQPRDENAPENSPGLGRAVTDLANYPIFAEILRRQMRSVTDMSEAAAGAILSNLSGVDNRVTALLTFIQQSGSSEQVTRVVEQVEAQMRGCRERLELFASRQQ